MLPFSSYIVRKNASVMGCLNTFNNRTKRGSGGNSYQFYLYYKRGQCQKNT